MNGKGKYIFSFLAALGLIVSVMTIYATGEEKTGNQAQAQQGKPQSKYYPKDYRKWWHVKSMVIEEGHPLFNPFGGVHHVYANDKAIEDLKKGEGRKFKDGAVIVIDFFEAVKANNAITEGKRKFVAYMKKDKAMKDTGGWEWGAYVEGDPQKPMVTDQVGQCFSCHTQVEKQDFVFSEWRP